MDFGWLVMGLVALALISHCSGNSPNECSLACDRQNQRMIEATPDTCKCEVK